MPLPYIVSSSPLGKRVMGQGPLQGLDWENGRVEKALSSLTLKTLNLERSSMGDAITDLVVFSVYKSQTFLTPA